MDWLHGSACRPWSLAIYSQAKNTRGFEWLHATVQPVRTRACSLAACSRAWSLIARFHAASENATSSPAARPVEPDCKVAASAFTLAEPGRMQ